ncbi:hypothetical protein Salat_1458300 [Sesamum alatum]|uniref:Uncharacterized protein n=1 Tax=Sesamum alatum TaxID=300844 RepID=A0AAE1YB07_9LAMI|nr:hypothetical protein Salat_1458300 [Sesamum alatum]
MFAPSTHTRVEEHHAHALNQAMAFGHHLSLKCTYLQREKISSDANLADLHKKFDESETSCFATEDKIKQLKAKLEDQSFRSQVELETTKTVALKTGKAEGF